jgi:hypothetical protein
MLKLPITYTNFADESVTDTFYFNLTAAELARMELSATDNMSEGLRDYLEKVIKSGKGQDILDAFENFITASYGKRSTDGKNFYKSEQLMDEFRSSGAYDSLFLQLVTDAEFGSKFVNGIMPADLAEQAQKIIDQQKQDDEPARPVQDNVTELKQPARDKRPTRSREELLAAFREKNAPAKDNKYLHMTEAEAMQLPEDEFLAWIDAQPEATPKV